MRSSQSHVYVCFISLCSKQYGPREMAFQITPTKQSDCISHDTLFAIFICKRQYCPSSKYSCRRRKDKGSRSMKLALIVAIASLLLAQSVGGYFIVSRIDLSDLEAFRSYNDSLSQLLIRLQKPRFLVREHQRRFGFTSKVCWPLNLPLNIAYSFVPYCTIWFNYGPLLKLWCSTYSG